MLNKIRSQFKNHVLLLSILFLTLISLLAAFAPWVAPYSYEEQNIAQRLEQPSLQHWMGTDPLGRDLYSRMIYGARMSLAVGVITAVLTLVLGTFTGSLAGYCGGWVDHLFIRLIDLFYIFPSILTSILFMIFFGRGFLGLLLALSITSWMGQARLVRAQVMQTKELVYVEAARAIGASHFSMIWSHILPNLWGPILTSLTIQIPTHIMSESFLSFIGLGLQPPFSSWGTLANEGFKAMRSYPHLMIFPGGIVYLTLLAFAYVGDGLRDYFNGNRQM